MPDGFSKSCQTGVLPSTTVGTSSSRSSCRHQWHCSRAFSTSIALRNATSALHALAGASARAHPKPSSLPQGLGPRSWLMSIKPSSSSLTSAPRRCWGSLPAAGTPSNLFFLPSPSLLLQKGTGWGDGGGSGWGLFAARGAAAARELLSYFSAHVIPSLKISLSEIHRWSEGCQNQGKLCL